MDGRADLYAAAVIGYEMLCGQPPFYSEDKLEVMSMHTAKPVPKGNPALGKKIFSVKCVPCHKADGSGGVKLTGNPTPNWRDAKRMADPKHDDAYLRDCITNGKPKSGMPTWSKQGVKPADIENLIAYIRTFSAPKK